jgi:hypothetical protein
LEFLNLVVLEINAPDTSLLRIWVMLASMSVLHIQLANGLDIFAVVGECTDKDLHLQPLVLVLAVMVIVVLED